MPPFNASPDSRKSDENNDKPQDEGRRNFFKDLGKLATVAAGGAVLGHSVGSAPHERELARDARIENELAELAPVREGKITPDEILEVYKGEIPHVESEISRIESEINKLKDDLAKRNEQLRRLSLAKEELRQRPDLQKTLDVMAGK
jgi:septal ring factor EnvC (AmiA/AmiB activator)